MVLRHNVVKNEFINEIKGKKLYCYGAGRVFEDFLQVYSMLNVNAVIDKALSEENIKDTPKGVPVISVDDFLNVYDKDSILIITCFDYQQVEAELSGYNKLIDLPCYVYCLIEGTFGIKNDNTVTNKYEIVEFKMQDYNAGQKAPADVAIIAAKAGFKLLTVNRGTHRYGSEQTKSEWRRIFEVIPDRATVLVQLPFVDSSDGVKYLYELKEQKHVNIIAVVHDIDILRGENGDGNIRQYEILKSLADVWIVHNKYMISELCNRGFDRNRMISLEIFDYLIDDFENVKYDEGIVVAGNLDKEKSKYIYSLNEIKDVKFNLFGANYSYNLPEENINYYGAFLPDELIHNLRGKFGLVWDGDSINTCSGAKGEYLRINNPHKLSLYLAIGLPVIIWSEAAEAEFVLKEKVGIAIKSLIDLPHILADIDDVTYKAMKDNVKLIGTKLRNGYYMKKAVEKAEIILNDMAE